MKEAIISPGSSLEGLQSEMWILDQFKFLSQVGVGITVLDQTDPIKSISLDE